MSSFFFSRITDIFLGLSLLTFAIVAGCAETSPRLVITDSPETSLYENQILHTSSAAVITFERMIDEIENTPVIYIGETHTRKRHHEIQLEIIREMFSRRPDLTVGMEMFSFPYQPVLNQWTNGLLTREEFLEKTHWYANWKFNFELYEDILRFIKKNRIPLAALNIPFHIPAKISVGGIQNLLPADQKYIPENMDTTNEAHRAYIKKVYSMHHIRGREKFEYFYLAQLSWEETMAAQIAETVRKSDAPVIVLAGSGHVSRKYGIPERAYRRTFADYKTILPLSAQKQAELSEADYIWATP